MTDDDHPFIFGAKYVRHRLGLAGPLPGRGALEDSFTAGVQAMGALLARLHPSEASRVLTECNAIREALAPDRRPRPVHRFAACANEYTLVIAGELRTIRIVD